MKFGFLVIVFMIFLVFASVSFAQNELSIGVSPSKIVLRDVETGSTKLVDFYIISPSEETILVKLEPEEPNIDKGNVNENTSEESIISWVKIIENPVELEPTSDFLETKAGVIKGQRKISFLIEVPDDAEPGEHMMNMKPIPITSQEEIGSVGGKVVALTSVGVLLDVAGNALRGGVILDVVQGNNMELETYFQNTGTVTISATGIQRIYDKEGNLVSEIRLGKNYVKPKEIKVFRGLLPKEGLSFDDYHVHTVIDYMTGEDEINSVIRILPPTALVVKDEGASTALLFVLIAIIFIASIIIYRKVK